MAAAWRSTLGLLLLLCCSCSGSSMAKPNSVPPVTRAYAAELLTQIDRRPRAAADVEVKELLSLWSGLSAVYKLDEHVVLKHIRWTSTPTPKELRQIESYKVEARFFERHAPRLLAPPFSLAIPRPLLVRAEPEGITICMSRLTGEPIESPLSLPDARAALEWLAAFHAASWGIAEAELDGLQADGSYWHLGIRLEELGRMPHDGWERRLCLAARALDARLKADAMQCTMHGDSKPANMLMRRLPGAAPCAELYDFQYTGRAPPSKDLANSSRARAAWRWTARDVRWAVGERGKREGSRPRPAMLPPLIALGTHAPPSPLATQVRHWRRRLGGGG
jgi:hypothetical protein